MKTLFAASRKPNHKKRFNDHGATALGTAWKPSLDKVSNVPNPAPSFIAVALRSTSNFRDLESLDKRGRHRHLQNVQSARIKLLEHHHMHMRMSEVPDRQTEEILLVS